MWLFAPKEIKHHVAGWILRNRNFLRNKTVLDCPAGNGVSSETLLKVGAHVQAYDLIPEFFRARELQCHFADLSKPLPIEDESVDYILCQEGIEHVPDQLKVFEEFSRILKPNGKLALTTPNYSNIRSRLSYLFGESELFGKILPPNEVDSIWFSPNNKNEIYFGHIYLIGIQKLRLFSKLSGLKLTGIVPTKVNTTSLLFFPLLYPFILLLSYMAYERALRKKGPKFKQIFGEVFDLAVHPIILLDNHLFLEFQKVDQAINVRNTLKQSSDANSFVT
jgi:SAM-dependent methyltransferase